MRQDNNLSIIMFLKESATACSKKIEKECAESCASTEQYQMPKELTIRTDKGSGKFEPDYDAMKGLNNNNRFSIFPRGYQNKKGQAVLAVKPQQTQTIEWVYEYIISERARWATEELRTKMETATKDELSDFKKLNFETATFNGIFSYRNAHSLVERSPYLVIDIDDLASTEEARDVQKLLVNDPHLETALCFVSPKGRGVKWVVVLPEWAQKNDFKSTFQILTQHVGFHYGIKVDKSGSDVCRACFLPYDPECYINTKIFKR